MTTVRANCETCGIVDLATDEVTVIVPRTDPPQPDPPDGQYRFRCPQCHNVTVTAARADAIALLLSAGCERLTFDAPDELADPARAGALLEHDEILDMLSVLDDDAAFRAELDRLT